MIFAGLDVGSRSTKLALLDGEGSLVDRQIVDTTYSPLSVCQGLLAGLEPARLVVTGYGRHLVREHLPEAEVITEIKAAGLGAARVSPGCRAVIDVGGQDTKAIALDPRGRAVKFAMNDRCAAGTGRFLEVMATALSMTREELVAAALSAEGSVPLSSMCAVFAESEVISLVARDVSRSAIARAIHESVAKRVVALAKRVPLEPPVLFIGGGALNEGLRQMIEARLGVEVHRPEEAQLVPALGCALHGLSGAYERRGGEDDPQRRSAAAG